MDENLFNASPVVVIGMHRSGTRLLDRVLEKLGVFMGADRQADGESVTFMLINEAIFQQCGSFWNEPMPIHFVLSDQSFLERTTELARAALTAHFAGYKGEHSPLDQASEEPPRFGWKDPRNTFTLPVWKQVFPKLKVIHVLRHGIDVAASLSRRHGEALRSATGERVPPALTVIRDHVHGVMSSRRGWNPAEALTMWEQYVEKARLELAEAGDSGLEVRFEELLLSPKQLIPKIAEFCGVAAPDELESLVEGIDPSRALAYREDPELRAFAESASEVLNRYGYSL